jgi:hypothetical protein
VLILPAKTADAGLAGGFENGHLNGLTANAAITGVRLILRDGLQRAVVNGFDETVAQGIERCAQGADIFRGRNVLLSFGNDGAIVDDGAAGNCGGAIVNRNGGIYKVATGIAVRGAQFGELAGAAADGVLMAIGASPRVKHGPKPVRGSWVVS